MACPYNAPHVSREAGHSMKCDGCKDRVAQGLQPICVESCSGRALFFGPIDELPNTEERAEVAPLPTVDYTQPNLYIKQCPNMRPSGSTEVHLSNLVEVN
jgi:Fe-S-cluster-containing dehydrogenase component